MWWGTRQCLNYLSVIKQSNMIDFVKCANISWRLCWSVMCKLPSGHINVILKSQKERKIGKLTDLHFSHPWWNSARFWLWCINWCCQKSCMNENCHKQHVTSLYYSRFCWFHSVNSWWTLFINKMRFSDYIYFFTMWSLLLKLKSVEFQELIFALYQW